jgi:hypothetical protein
MQEMHDKQNEALVVLIEAVKFAHSKGTYNLKQTELIINAIKVFEIQEVSDSEQK